METRPQTILNYSIRHKQVQKARVWKFFLHLFNTYGIIRHAWYLLIIRLSFVSPNQSYSTTDHLYCKVFNITSIHNLFYYFLQHQHQHQHRQQYSHTNISVNTATSTSRVHYLTNSAAKIKAYLIHPIIIRKTLFYPLFFIFMPLFFFSFYFFAFSPKSFFIIISVILFIINLKLYT